MMKKGDWGDGVGQVLGFQSFVWEMVHMNWNWARREGPLRYMIILRTLF